MSASPASDGRDDVGELRRVVLAVAVDAHGELVALLPGVAEAGLDGAADAEVERQPEHVRAARPRATSAVRSVEPSETTTTSRPGSNARSSSSTRPMFRSSLKAGTIAIRRSAASCATGAAGVPRRSVDMRRHPEADQLEQPPRAVAVGVLVEHALARAPPHLLGLRRVVEQVAVGGDRLGRVVDDEQLASPARTSARSRRTGWRRSPRPAAASSNGRHDDEA